MNGRAPARAVFLDRDGTLNVEKHYLYKEEDWEWIPGVPEALARLARAGWRLAVVSNQSGIARGYYSAGDVDRLHDFVNRDLASRADARIDLFLYCPHDPSSTCDCRKPAPGLLREAARRLGVDLAESWMIGDKEIDIAAGRAAGCRCVLVRTGYGRSSESALPPGVPAADDLAAAVELALVPAR